MATLARAFLEATILVFFVVGTLSLGERIAAYRAENVEVASYHE